MEDEPKQPEGDESKEESQSTPDQGTSEPAAV